MGAATLSVRFKGGQAAALGRKTDAGGECWGENLWGSAVSFDHWHDWLLVIFTALLAFFTARLWLTTRILQRAYIAVEPHGVHSMVSVENYLICELGALLNSL